MFPIVQDSDTPYDCNTFLQQLPAYNCNAGVDSLLDLARIINESDNYMWVGAAIPTIPPGTTVAAGNVGAFQTINGTLSLPSGTYIISLNHYCSPTTGNPNPPPNGDYGFKIKLSDKGTKASIFYGDYALDKLISSPGNITLTRDLPRGSAYLKSPFIITPSGNGDGGTGNLNWEIVNLSNLPCLIQVMVQCAVPVNNKVLGTQDIKV